MSYLIHRIVKNATEPQMARLQRLQTECEKKSKVGIAANILINFAFGLRAFANDFAVFFSSLLRVELITRPELETCRQAELAQVVGSQKYRFIVRQKIRVLIVADLGLEQCVHYRITQKLEMLKNSDVEVEVLSFAENDLLWSKMSLFSHIIFYRTPGTRKILELQAAAKRIGIVTIFESDDLVFDPFIYAKHPYFANCSRRERKLSLKNSQLMSDLSRVCEHSIASTSFLERKLSDVVPGETFLLRNKLDINLKPMVSLLGGYAEFKSTRQRIYVGYASGSNSHDHDFELIARPLARALNAIDGLTLVLLGHVALPKQLFGFENRIIRVPPQERQHFYKHLVLLDINLAPLVPSDFNESKSNIKFLEAAVLKVPTIASPRQEFERCINHKINGFLADSDDEWFEAIVALATNIELRARIGETAAVEVEKEFSFNRNLEQQFVDWLTSLSTISEDENFSNQLRLRIVRCSGEFAPFIFPDLGGQYCVNVFSPMKSDLRELIALLRELSESLCIDSFVFLNEPTLAYAFQQQFESIKVSFSSSAETLLREIPGSSFDAEEVYSRVTHESLGKVTSQSV